MDQSALGPVSQFGNRPLSNPPTRPSVMVGKKAARAIPTCSLAEATLLSALGNIRTPFEQVRRQAREEAPAE